jgi:class 3 adenylate cyclase
LSRGVGGYEDGAVHRSSDPRSSTVVVVAAVFAPLAGLAVLLGVPSFDLRWEHHPSHFWLVLGVAVLNVVLGVAVSEAARRRQDVRLFLVSMALLASAGFLALHALATPGVVLAGPNGGFSLATPIGLLIASGFAALSSLDLEAHEATWLRLQRPMRVGLIAVILAWAVASLLEAGFMSRVFETERAPWLLTLLPLGVAAYAFAAWRYLGLYRTRDRPLPLVVAMAFVLLAEALVVVALSRGWHLSWWEWHVLMAVAFVAILLAVRHEYRAERSLAGTFRSLYLERTLERLDARESNAMTKLARADADRSLDEATEELRTEGFTGDEIAVLLRSSRELSKLEGLLRRYVGAQLADRLGADPGLADLGGDEREVSVLFADLAGFTSFAEGRPAPEVIDMLNTYWSEVVPTLVDREGGLVERFAGDAVLVVFNALGDQPDHAVRATRAAIELRDASERVHRGSNDWPRFRVGVNTGPVVVGNVGADAQRSFSAIGDTTNVAARLQAMSTPGHITIAERTLADARRTPGVEVQALPLGQVDLKGKAEPMEAFELLSVAPR